MPRQTIVIMTLAERATEGSARPEVEIRLLGGFEVLLRTTPGGGPAHAEALPEETWRRRQAAALLKLLALAPGRRLHREQVLDALWPDVPVDEAAPRLHKAAHYARRALRDPESVVLRGEVVVLCPDRDVTTDVRVFEHLAEQALGLAGAAERPPRGDVVLTGETPGRLPALGAGAGVLSRAGGPRGLDPYAASRAGGAGTAGPAPVSPDPAAAARAAAAYGGPLLPDDLYEPWTQADRDRLRLLYLRLLRAAGRWERVLAEDPADEEAHLTLMRGYVARGERPAALRQFERMDRALRRELGVGPGAEALALRAALLARPAASDGVTGAARGPAPAVRLDGLVGRHADLRLIEKQLTRASARDGTDLGPRGGAVLVSGVAGVGKSALLSEVARCAAVAGWLVGRGTAAAVEGAWPYAPVLEAFADLYRRHPSLLDRLNDHCRRLVERAMASGLGWTGGDGHQQIFVAAAQLLRYAAQAGQGEELHRAGALLVLDDLQDADDASLRLVHYLVRSLAGLPVVVLLAHRTPPGDKALPPRLAEIRASLLARGVAIPVDLASLGRADTATLVARELRAAASSGGSGVEVGDERIAPLVERIWQASQGLPFTVIELARRAAANPTNLSSLDAAAVDGFPSPTRDLLRRLAVAGHSFDTDEFVVFCGLPEPAAYALLDDLLDAGVLDRTDDGFRFRHHLVRDALLADLPPHRRRATHREVADGLAAIGASAARVGHHLIQAGERARAVAPALRAAEESARVGAYRDALALVDEVRDHARGGEWARLLALRADLLTALADPGAPAAYREAIAMAAPSAVRPLLARLARALLMAGEVEAAAATLDGLPADGDDADAGISLARGLLAYFGGDVDRAAAIAAEARGRVVAGAADRLVCDLIALQGLVAHHRGEFFGQMAAELRRTSYLPALAATVFDAHLCIAEYMLYGSTPYPEVVRLADQLRDAAEQAGAARAVAFAECLAGEAHLLAGDLDRAERRLTSAVDLHRGIGAAAGEAHSLQRLAQARLVRGDRAEANRLLVRALPLARWSPIAAHLLHRVYGTMVVAAPDVAAALDELAQAEEALGVDDGCLFCSVSLAVPATIVSARVGDLARARRHLAVARRSALLWEGTAWQAATREAEAYVARLEGEPARALALLAAAGRLFDYVGHPSDAARCRAAAAGAHDGADHDLDGARLGSAQAAGAGLLDAETHGLTVLGGPGRPREHPHAPLEDHGPGFLDVGLLFGRAQPAGGLAAAGRTGSRDR